MNLIVGHSHFTASPLTDYCHATQTTVSCDAILEYYGAHLVLDHQKTQKINAIQFASYQ